MTPGSMTAAVRRCSNARARGIQEPAWLTPIAEIRWGRRRGVARPRRARARVRPPSGRGLPARREWPVGRGRRKSFSDSRAHWPLRRRVAMSAGRAFAAVVDDDERSALLRVRVGVGRPEEICRQSSVLVGDGDAFSGDWHAIDGPVPAPSLATPDIQLALGFELGGVRYAIQRCGVVRRGAAIVGKRTGRSSCRIRLLTGRPGRSGDRGPLRDPRVRVSVADAADGREHLPDVGSLAVAAAKRFLHAELKSSSLKKTVRAGPPGSRRPCR